MNEFGWLMLDEWKEDPGEGEDIIMPYIIIDSETGERLSASDAASMLTSLFPLIDTVGEYIKELGHLKQILLQMGETAVIDDRIDRMIASMRLMQKIL